MLKTVQFNPNKRLTAEQILKHPYVRQFNKINQTENIRKIYLEISETKKKSVKEYKKLIYEWVGKTYCDDMENQCLKNSNAK